MKQKTNWLTANHRNRTENLMTGTELNVSQMNLFLDHNTRCLSKEGSMDSSGLEFQQLRGFEWVLWSLSYTTFIGCSAALEVDMSPASLNHSLLFWNFQPCLRWVMLISSQSASAIYIHWQRLLLNIAMHEEKWISPLRQGYMNEAWIQTSWWRLDYPAVRAYTFPRAPELQTDMCALIVHFSYY